MAKKSTHTEIEIVPYESNTPAMRVPGGPLSALVVDSGCAAEIAWDDFFDGTIANYHTRVAYERAVRSFLVWCQESVPDKALHQIMAGDVGRYLRQLGGGLQKKKQHLAGLRKFFNLLVERHVIVLNPAAVAETERLQVIEGPPPLSPISRCGSCSP